MGNVIPESTLVAKRLNKRLASVATKFKVTKVAALGAMIRAQERLLELEHILYTSPHVEEREAAVIESIKVRNEMMHLIN